MGILPGSLTPSNICVYGLLTTADNLPDRLTAVREKLMGKSVSNYLVRTEPMPTCYWSATLVACTV